MEKFVILAILMVFLSGQAVARMQPGRNEYPVGIIGEANNKPQAMENKGNYYKLPSNIIKQMIENAINGPLKCANLFEDCAYTLCCDGLICANKLDSHFLPVCAYDL